MHIDMSTLAPIQAYALMTQTVIPRPVAWVLTENDDKSHNLAPFSYFNGLASDPPMIMISIGLAPDGSIKDTRVNIEERKHFIVHIAHREMAEAMTKSSATMPRNESEITMLDLELAEMPGSSLPRLKDCRIAYACEYDSMHMIKDQSIVFAHLKHLYVDDAITGKDAKGRMCINAIDADPLGRLGGGEYFGAGELIYVERPA
ncbi:protein/domain typically associated with flavoprotein oxygenase, DIM6/NTAB family protein [Chromatiales bacterium (ex Bugula neritina AB1)]|nr:protein/domain typically associated with flavoprotein oxygenase, DIM6/NTAB family protein [Chromatiales bacterium (ex Bugula neritina AB1)]